MFKINQDKINYEQIKRFHACIRTITIQLYERANKERELWVKNMILMIACEHGYPFEIKNGIVEPTSIGKVTEREGNLANMALNYYADNFFAVFKIPMYLMQRDKTKRMYKSVGGRTRQEMMKDFPEVYYG